MIERRTAGAPADGARDGINRGESRQERPPGAAQPARKRPRLGTLHPWQESGLAKIRGFGEALDRQIICFPDNRTMQTRLPRRVFALWVLVSRPRANRERTGAELRLHGQRGVIISRLQPARLRLLGRRVVWDMPLAAHAPASGIHF